MRTLDAAGVAIDLEPTVRVISNGVGTAVSLVESYDSRYPGFYHVRVRLSSESGDNVFEIQNGDVTARVTISGS